MKKINIKAFLYKARHQYITLNNIVVLVALLIAASWVWGALGMMQRNYSLQKEVDYKRRQLQLIELQTANLDLQRRYFQTAEYQELAARESLNLVMPGERLLILPKQTTQQASTSNDTQTASEEPGNFTQWINFLFGGYSNTRGD